MKVNAKFKSSAAYTLEIRVNKSLTEFNHIFLYILFIYKFTYHT